jgi:glycosyltransferase involved in cell wall biosynthesis
MNILLISHFFPPHKGGVETAAYYTAKYLNKLGHEVVVLASKTKNNNSISQESTEFKIYRYRAYSLPEIKGLPQSSSLGLSPRAIFNLPRIIKKHNIDVIHAKGQFFPLSFITAFLNELIFHRPMFITVEGRLKFGLTGLIENLFDLIITGLLYQRLEMIICVSNSLKKRLLEYRINPEILKVIPNGVDLEIYSGMNIEGKDFFRKHFPQKSDYKKVIFVGRFSKQKGVQYLLKAIPNVIAEIKNVHFFLLGSGESDNLEKELKTLAKNLNINPNVTFLHTVHLEENSKHIPLDKHFSKIAQFYSSADIFCLPSIHEGFPLTIVEALSTGLIIVASRVEGIPEVINNGENGYLCEPKNISELSNKLIKALQIPSEQRKKIHTYNLNLVKRKYSWEIITKQLESLYYRSLKKIHKI